MNALYASQRTTTSWDYFLRFRPKCPETLWLSWLTYHSGPLEVYHDIGSEIGSAASKVIRAATGRGHRISHAHVSDPDVTSLALAERLLMAQPDFNKVAFSPHLNRAQDSFLPPGSVDLVTACECMHWTAFDTDAAMASIAESLRPGGTFAAVFHHLVGVVEGNDRAADALWRVQVERFEDMMSEDAYSSPECGRALLNCAMGLDFLPFDTEEWTDVRRIYVNVEKDRNKRPLWPWAESVWTFGERPENRVDVNREKVQVLMEPGWDIRQCTVDWVKHCLMSSKLGFGPHTWDSEAWREFVEAVSGQRGGNFYLRMPAVVVLARKR